MTDPDTEWTTSGIVPAVVWADSLARILKKYPMAKLFNSISCLVVIVDNKGVGYVDIELGTVYLYTEEEMNRVE